MFWKIPKNFQNETHSYLYRRFSVSNSFLKLYKRLDILVIIFCNILFIRFHYRQKLLVRWQEYLICYLKLIFVGQLVDDWVIFVILFSWQNDTVLVKRQILILFFSNVLMSVITPLLSSLLLLLLLFVLLLVLLLRKDNMPNFKSFLNSFLLKTWPGYVPGFKSIGKIFSEDISVFSITNDDIKSRNIIGKDLKTTC